MKNCTYNSSGGYHRIVNSPPCCRWVAGEGNSATEGRGETKMVVEEVDLAFEPSLKEYAE